MNDRIKKIDFEFIINAAISMVFAITQVKVIMYFVLIIQLMKFINLQKKSKDKRNAELIKLIVVTLFLPDNYLIIVASIFVLFICFKEYKYKIKKYYCIAILYVSLNILLFGVHTGNIIMFAIYTIPFFIMETCFPKLMTSTFILHKKVI